MNAPAQKSGSKNGQHNGSNNGKQNAGANGANGGGRRRNRKRRNKTKAIADYWGDKDKLPEPTSDIRITEDPSAVVRSLGRPPLPGQEHASEAYFAAVYARAVGLASALAAAGELIEPEELLDD